MLIMYDYNIYMQKKNQSLYVYIDCKQHSPNVANNPNSSSGRQSNQWIPAGISKKKKKSIFKLHAIIVSIQLLSNHNKQSNVIDRYHSQLLRQHLKMCNIKPDLKNHVSISSLICA